MIAIADRIAEIRSHIDQLCTENNRESEAVQIIAVSKRQPIESIVEAYQLGQRAFAENYLQEALEKQQNLAKSGNTPDIDWHFIGHIQSNKTKPIAENFNWVHTVESFKIARRLSSAREAQNVGSDNQQDLNICLQINIDNDQAKGGILVENIEALADLVREIMQLPQLNVRGLMTIPAATENLAETERSFAEMKQLFQQLNALLLDRGSDVTHFDTLSMGMSGDYPAAIKQGATMLRLGSILFGARLS